MPTHTPSAAPLRWLGQRVFYGWTMLAVSGLMLFVTGPAQSFTFSVFVTPITESLALSRTSVSAAYGLATLAAAFLLPAVGRMVDRHGVRRVALALVLLMGLAAAGFGQVRNLALLALGFGLLRFLGQGSLMLCANNLVAQWFSRKRGFALSLMSLGFSAGFAFYPPFAQWLMELVGWRLAWLWLGVLTVVLMLPPLLLVRDTPEEVGLLPDGDAQPDAEQAAAAVRVAGVPLSEALRMPVFWVVGLAAGTVSMLVTGMVFHQVSILAENGLDLAMSAAVFPVTAGAMVASMPVLGWMLDRLPTPWMLCLGSLLYVAALLLMITATTPALAVLFALVFGVAQGAMLTNSTFVTPAYFGRRYLGAVQGVSKTIGIVGASIGPFPLGMAYDLLGGYREALLLLAALPLAMAVAVLVVKPPDLTLPRYAE